MKRTFSFFLFLSLFYSLSSEAQLLRIVTYAGTGIAGYGGDGYAATAADLNGPLCVALDKYSNLYISDFFNNRVRKVKTDGSIVTFAGNGTSGNTGNGTAATSAEVVPHGVAADFRGNVYLSDPFNNVIRKVNTLGIISVYAGTGAIGYLGDSGPATAATLNAPYGMTTDSRGNLFFADAGNHVIRMIDTFGTITTVAGSGTAGYTGNGGAATDATLDSPYAVTIDRSGNLFIADHNNNVIRMVDPTGLISTYAGTGTIGYTGDNGVAASGTFHFPAGVAVDTSGNLFIADSYNNVIREVEAITTKLTTIAGNGFAGFGGDLGFPTGANLFHPYSVAVDTIGSIYIADANNERVRKVYNPLLVSVDQVQSTANISVAPNPFSTDITISGLSSADRICVNDMAGRIVANEAVTANGKQVYSLSDLASGNYLLQVLGADGAKKAVVKISKK